jgi:hypothetical protein
VTSLANDWRPVTLTEKGHECELGERLLCRRGPSMALYRPRSVLLASHRARWGVFDDRGDGSMDCHVVHDRFGHGCSAGGSDSSTDPGVRIARRAGIHFGQETVGVSAVGETSSAWRLGEVASYAW